MISNVPVPNPALALEAAEVRLGLSTKDGVVDRLDTAKKLEGL
jgi:hypothetical protein